MLQTVHKARRRTIYLGSGETNLKKTEEAVAVLPTNIARYFAFCSYPDLGVIGWHLADSRFQWASDWDMILNAIGDGHKRAVIYPYASVAYFEPSGIIS